MGCEARREAQKQRHTTRRGKRFVCRGCLTDGAAGPGPTGARRLATLPELMKPPSVIPVSTGTPSAIRVPGRRPLISGKPFALGVLLQVAADAGRIDRAPLRAQARIDVLVLAGMPGNERLAVREPFAQAHHGLLPGRA